MLEVDRHRHRRQPGRAACRSTSTIEGVLGSERDRDDAQGDRHAALQARRATPRRSTCPFRRKDIETRVHRDRARSPTRAAARTPRSTRSRGGRRGRRATSRSSPTSTTLQARRRREARDPLEGAAGDRDRVVRAPGRDRAEARRADAASRRSSSCRSSRRTSRTCTSLVDRLAKRQRTAQLERAALPLPEHTSASRSSSPVDVESARLVDAHAADCSRSSSPASEATFEVEVKHDDKPVAGAEVALIVVDEAVLALSQKSHADPLAPFYREVGDGTWTRIDARRWSTDAGDDARRRARASSATSSTTAARLRHRLRLRLRRRARRHERHASARVRRRRQRHRVKARKDFRATAVFSPRLAHRRARQGRGSPSKMPDSLTRFRIVALADRRTRATSARPRARSSRSARSTRAPSRRASSPRATRSRCRSSCRTSTARRARSTSPCAPRTSPPPGPPASASRSPAASAPRSGSTSRPRRAAAVIQTIALSRRLRRCVERRAAGLRAGDHRVVRDLRHRRRRAAVRAARGAGRHLRRRRRRRGRARVDAAAVADRRVLVPLRVSVRVRRAALEPHARDGRDVRHPRGVRDAGRPTRKPRSTADRARRPAKLAQRSARRRRLGLLPRHEVGSVRHACRCSPRSPRRRRERRRREARDRRSSTKRGRPRCSPSLEARPPRDADARTDRAELALPDRRSPRRADRARRRRHRRPRARRAAARARDRRSAPIPSTPRRGCSRSSRSTPRAKAMRDEAARRAALGRRTRPRRRRPSPRSSTEAERLLLVSNTKTTALALDALMREAPEHALITKLARGVLDARARGRWSSTQENLVVLQAMRRYFDIYEKDDAELHRQAVVRHRRVRRAGVRRPQRPRAASRSVDWSDARAGLDARPRAARRPAPAACTTASASPTRRSRPNLPPLDAGFIVRRTYTRDRRSDRRRRSSPTAAGRSSSARACSSRSRRSTRRARHAVALVDPLPAGFEAVNTSLATAERAVRRAERDRLGLPSHMRDNRSEVFAMQLAEGSAPVLVHGARDHARARSSPRRPRPRRCTARRPSAARPGQTVIVE